MEEEWTGQRLRRHRWCSCRSSAPLDSPPRLHGGPFSKGRFAANRVDLAFEARTAGRVTYRSVLRKPFCRESLQTGPRSANCRSRGAPNRSSEALLPRIAANWPPEHELPVSWRAESFFGSPFDANRCKLAPGARTAGGAASAIVLRKAHLRDFLQSGVQSATGT